MGLAEAVKGGRRRRGRVRLQFDDDARAAWVAANDRARRALVLSEDDPEREAAAVALEQASAAYDDALDTLHVQALPAGQYADLLTEYLPEGDEEPTREQNRAFEEAFIRATLVEDELPEGVDITGVLGALADGQWKEVVQAAVMICRGSDTVGKSESDSGLILAMRARSGTSQNTESDGQSGSDGQKTTKPTRSPGSKRRT